MMHPLRKHRLIVIIAVMILLSGAVALALYSLKQNINLFYTPSQIVRGEAPTHRAFRAGGMVVKKSLQRESDGLTVHFKLTDTAKIVEVVYRGVLPDLFREGQGIVAEGQLNSSGQFIAERVLAKHDEKYMPPEVTFAVKKSHDS